MMSAHMSTPKAVQKSPEDETGSVSRAHALSLSESGRSRRASTLAARMRRSEVIANFWSFVEFGDGCWLWMGSRNRAGYGLFRGLSASHIAYDLCGHRVRGGLYVLHHCDNPPCVRPDHLWLGTARDNARDMVQKGRHWSQRRAAALIANEKLHAAVNDVELNTAGTACAAGQLARI